MDQEYEERLSRLNRLNDITAEPTPSHPKQPQKPTKKRATKFTKAAAITLVISIISQLAIWWVYPLIYSRNLAGGQWQQNPLFVIYTILLAIAVYFTIGQSRYKISTFAIVLIPVAFLYFLYQQMTGQQVALLSLLPVTLILINIHYFNLKNIVGLNLYAAIATLSVPVAIFYQQNTFLTIPFIYSLLPLFFSYLYYTASIFITNTRHKRIASLIFGVILMIIVLTLPWNIWTLLAVILIVFTWLILINLTIKTEYMFGILSALQAITILAIFLQQK
ncbi:hypothetical protein ACRHK7_04240 [Weissella tructae]|uniref:Integral membrane protein n=2 Tax=Weissella TaxID=46255 RepID=A0A075TU62_9LACO|nr:MULTISPECIES: hypothetical protein [Weissella]AIG65059.1 hypothetical protein WS08_0120 [Weissella tructae]AIM62371.1 hypothetical protein WS74_0119 [Weissella ceti]AIM63709.1 hypothetical protein WS105_0119 [Weissella ceti]ELA07748.1 integral membrane protein [Weissella ceti NC36]QVV91460.1 hypothetical protein KHQ32_00695 [Weissella tructae]